MDVQPRTLNAEPLNLGKFKPVVEIPRHLNLGHCIFHGVR